MYSWEIRDFVNSRSGKLNKSEFYQIINNVTNPQIKNVSKVRDNYFLIVTDDNWGFEVKVIDK